MECSDDGCIGWLMQSAAPLGKATSKTAPVSCFVENQMMQLGAMNSNGYGEKLEIASECVAQVYRGVCVFVLGVRLTPDDLLHSAVSKQLLNVRRSKHWRLHVSSLILDRSSWNRGDGLWSGRRKARTC